MKQIVKQMDKDEFVNHLVNLKVPFDKDEPNPGDLWCHPTKDTSLMISETDNYWPHLVCIETILPDEGGHPVILEDKVKHTMIRKCIDEVNEVLLNELWPVVQENDMTQGQWVTFIKPIINDMCSELSVEPVEERNNPAEYLRFDHNKKKKANEYKTKIISLIESDAFDSSIERIEDRMKASLEDEVLTLMESQTYGGFSPEEVDKGTKLVLSNTQLDFNSNYQDSLEEEK